MENLNYNTYEDVLHALLVNLSLSFGENLVSVVLYGSVARGTANASSDIDLLVVHEKVSDDPVKLFVAAQLKTEKEEPYRKLRDKGLYPSFSPFLMTPRELAERPLILLDIAEQGRILKDKDGFLVSALERLKQRLAALGTRKIEFGDGTWAWELKPDWRPGELIEVSL